MTRTPTPTTTVRTFFDRLNDHDFDVIDELCADDFSVEIELKGREDAAIGTEGVRAMYEEYLAAFPDVRHDVVELVAEGERVAVFMRTSGTHDGAFRGVPPTGNHVTIDDSGLLRVVDGEIVEMWPQSDMLGLYEQLGVGLDR